MTIIIGTRRSDYAVLAADRMQSTSDRQPAGFHQKYSIHPTLPLACVTAGVTALPVLRWPVFQQVTDIVLRSFSGISPGFAPRDVVERLKADLTGSVQLLRRFRTGRERALSNVRLFVAMFACGSPHLWQLDIAADLPDIDVYGLWDAPESVRPYYRERLVDPNNFYYGRAFDRASHAEHIRTIVSDGIVHEAGLNGGRNHECGGEVDVLLVDNAGARLVEP